MISINDSNRVECCGCGSCAQNCPKNCINMTADKEGFLYPVVDTSACINCGACDRACPIIDAKTRVADSYKTPKAFGGYHKDDKVREDSSSGGAFTALAERIFADGGKVYGCTLNSDNKAVHIGVSSMEELASLRKSKYVQSEIGNCYAEIKKDLQNGLKVLFVGASCQAAGLATFLGNKKYDNLIVVDFICHGVPSPKLFEEYISHEESANKDKIVDFRFRNKDRGWNQSGLQLGVRQAYSNGKVVRKYPAFRDSYMNAFLDDVCLRPSCYDCRFKKVPNAYSDFTIADFWGVDKVAPELNDGKGTSLVIAHNDKAVAFFDGATNFNSKEVPFEKAIVKNPTIYKSCKMTKSREQFYEDLNNKGFKYAKRKYMSWFTWGMHKATKIAKAKLGIK